MSENPVPSRTGPLSPDLPTGQAGLQQGKQAGLKI